MSAATHFTLPSALALVFGTPPFATEYTTEHIAKVLGKLLGQQLSEEAVLVELRAADYATPRPGAGKHLLKWRFTRAELPGQAARSAPSAGKKRRYVPRQERPIAQSMNLKR